MRSVLRPIRSILLFASLVCVASPLVARQQPSMDGSTTIGPKLPVVVASASGAKVRFTAPGATVAQNGQVEGVKYDHLTVVLINAVKQLEDENKLLRERVEKLEQQAARQ